MRVLAYRRPASRRSISGVIKRTRGAGVAVAIRAAAGGIAQRLIGSFDQPQPRPCPNARPDPSPVAEKGARPNLSAIAFRQLSQTLCYFK